MTQDILRVAEDDRIIESISTETTLWRLTLISKDPRITKIVPYYEPGQGGLVPWFAIYQDDEIMERVNGTFVVDVVYKEKK